MNAETVTISRPFKTTNNREVVDVLMEIGFEETIINKDDKVVVGSYNQQWNDFQYVIKEKHNWDRLEKQATRTSTVVY